MTRSEDVYMTNVFLAAGYPIPEEYVFLNILAEKTDGVFDIL